MNCCSISATLFHSCLTQSCSRCDNSRPPASRLSQWPHEGELYELVSPPATPCYSNGSCRGSFSGRGHNIRWSCLMFRTCMTQATQWAHAVGFAVLLWLVIWPKTLSTVCPLSIFALNLITQIFLQMFCGFQMLKVDALKGLICICNITWKEICYSFTYIECRKQMWYI